MIHFFLVQWHKRRGPDGSWEVSNRIEDRLAPLRGHGIVMQNYYPPFEGMQGNHLPPVGKPYMLVRVKGPELVRDLRNIPHVELLPDIHFRRPWSEIDGYTRRDIENQLERAFMRQAMPTDPKTWGDVINGIARYINPKFKGFRREEVIERDVL